MIDIVINVLAMILLAAACYSMRQELKKMNETTERYARRVETLKKR